MPPGDSRFFLAQRRKHRLGYAARRLRVRKIGGDDGEFVAAKPGQHLSVAQHAGSAVSHLLQHGVASGVAEEVIHFLEPVEVEQHERQLATFATAFAIWRGCGDLGFQAAGEATAVGKAGERVVIRKPHDLLFGLPAFAYVAHGHDQMRLAAIIDSPGDQLHRYPAVVLTAEVGFLRLSVAGANGRRNSFAEQLAQPHRVQRAGGDAAQRRDAVVGADDAVAVADDEAFDGSIGEAVHALRLDPVTAEAQIDPQRGGRQHQNDEACRRGCESLRHRSDREFRDLDRGIRIDRDGGHGDEMQRADRQRQQDGTGDCR